MLAQMANFQQRDESPDRHICTPTYSKPLDVGLLENMRTRHYNYTNSFERDC